MEVLGGLLLSLVALVLLALVGVTAIAGISLMVILGLLSNMSFKRLFFVSFGLGLLAPAFLGIAAFAALEDGSLERDLRDAFPPPEAIAFDMQEIIPKLEELERDLENDDLTEKEIEQRLEDLFTRPDRLQIDLEGVELSENGNTVQAQME